MTIIVLESLFTKLHKIIERCGIKLTVTNFLMYFYSHVFWHLHIPISVTNNKLLSVLSTAYAWYFCIFNATELWQYVLYASNNKNLSRFYDKKIILIIVIISRKQRLGIRKMSSVRVSWVVINGSLGWCLHIIHVILLWCHIGGSQWG